MSSFLKLDHIEEFGLDDPRRTLAHKQIILSKPFLKRLYVEWYTRIKEELPVNAQKIVELGSGGGFMKDVIENVITSDVLELPDNDMMLNGLDMSFEDNSIDAFVMVDVFHHVPDSEKFLAEMYRTLKPGGRIIMSEPCNSIWGRFIYQNFHHETFNPKGGWTIPGSGPMSDANGALPYIVFERDQAIFKSKFPGFEILKNRKHTPLRYLLSGGVSMKQLVPNASFKIISGIENLLSPFRQWFSMFQLIVIEKKK